MRAQLADPRVRRARTRRFNGQLHVSCLVDPGGRQLDPDAVATSDADTDGAAAVVLPDDGIVGRFLLRDLAQVVEGKGAGAFQRGALGSREPGDTDETGGFTVSIGLPGGAYVGFGVAEGAEDWMVLEDGVAAEVGEAGGRVGFRGAGEGGLVGCCYCVCALATCVADFVGAGDGDDSGQVEEASDE